MILIALKPGIQTQISDEDFELCFYNWFFGVKRYAMRNINYNTEYMHHLIIKRMGLTVPDNMKIDHEDRNSLNNQRHNLRIITHSLNIHNSNLRTDNTIGYKGIYFDKRYNSWVVTIYVENIKMSLGSYSTLNEAIEARRLAEIKYLKRTES